MPAATGASVSAEWLSVRLSERCGALAARLPSEAYEALALYAERLLAWGRRINLTGASDAGTVADDLIADTLHLLPHLPVGPFSGIDVGSGAGLPGVVLAIARPEASWTLLEPNGKKVAFLAQVRRELATALPGSGGLVVRQGRLGAAETADLEAGFDLAVSRAVWPAAEWLERARPLLRPGARVLGLASHGAGPELPTDIQTVSYELGGRRRLVLVRDVA